MDFIRDLVNKKAEIDKIDLSYLLPKMHRHNAQYLNLPPGQEPYKLYKYITYNMHGYIITEFGVLFGASLVVWASNRDNHVVAYDIEDQRTDACKDLYNTAFYRMSATDAIAQHPMIKGSKLIYVDTIHNGVEELATLNALRNIGYHGITIWDDINLNDEMKSFFSSVKEEKIDLSAVGHWSGTGIIIL